MCGLLSQCWCYLGCYESITNGFFLWGTCDWTRTIAQLFFLVHFRRLMRVALHQKQKRSRTGKTCFVLPCNFLVLGNPDHGGDNTQHWTIVVFEMNISWGLDLLPVFCPWLIQVNTAIFLIYRTYPDLEPELDEVHAQSFMNIQRWLDD